jgi:hypothetical protein
MLTGLAYGMPWQLGVGGAVAVPSSAIQSVNASLERATAVHWTGPNGNYHASLPNPSLAGNTLIVFISVGLSTISSTSFTITDDKANTWNFGVVKTDATNGWGIIAYYASNIAAGTQVLTIKNNTGADISRHQISYMEIVNAGALDGSASNLGSSATITAGSITPTQSGDVFVQFSVRPITVSVSTASFTAGTQANIPWALTAADLRDGNATQMGVYNSTAALNPTMTMGDSSAFLSLALAFKSSAGGTARGSGIKITSIHHADEPGTSLASVTGVGSAFTNPNKIAAPGTGNLIVVAHVYGGTGSTINSITDTNGNTYTACGAVSNGQGGSQSRIWRAENATCSSDNVLTVTHSDNAADSTILVYNIIGAASSPFDLYVTATGNNGSPGSVLNAPNITPTTANGLVIGCTGIDFDTLNGLVAAGLVFDSIVFDGESTSGPDCMDENNGWGHYYNPNTSQVVFSWTEVDSQHIGGWDACAAAFKAA